MTQKIFDTDNEEDMALLWSILPDRVFKIHTSEKHTYYSDGDETQYFDVSNLIAFNWHDKTEITRPIQEATEADIGKLCYFWDDKVFDDEEEYKVYAILTLKDVAGGKPYYIADGNSTYEHCRRLTKQEIEELC